MVKYVTNINQSVNQNFYRDLNNKQLLQKPWDETVKKHAYE